nr:hypothetical protein [Microbacterium mitrae]
MRFQLSGTAVPPHNAPASEPAIAATVSVSLPPRMARSIASSSDVAPATAASAP